MTHPAVVALGPHSFRRIPAVSPVEPTVEDEITSVVTTASSNSVTDQILRESKAMNKLAEAAERIRAKKAAHAAKGDEWLQRLDALDAKEPDAFAAGDAAIAERETDLGDMEATVRTLGNLGTVSEK